MRTKIFIVSIVIYILLAISLYALANNIHNEEYYRARWCQNSKGEAEVVFKDGTRCDYITDTHAIEFDFASKWAEAIGQSLHYSLMSGKRAGIVLILRSEKDNRYKVRLERIITEYKLPIDLWIIHGWSEK